MCKYCTKLSPLIRGYDTGLKEPVFRALAALHQNIEPNLGDCYQWRHEKTSAVRRRLGAVEKVLRLDAVREIMQELDHEIIELKESMVEHPPSRKGGLSREDIMVMDVTPSQSASMEKKGRDVERRAAEQALDAKKVGEVVREIESC
ncbi:uncharacterized protein LY89DRAFT_508869 [Mollisia scopiformis]|uniref:Uncharacterized protein n=1 Tax=Mollisia scopiformis TaxID=149040 RepID=A0A194XGS5_MOLSC|nr:uncharacterized protein LY89DRAFT_508869 [Mollisia scopiformis]KUJ18972.1 hypothetical protein LY89DRAFT_508869 [Mollisia scopiformis]